MRIKAEDMIGKSLLEISIKAQVRLLYLAKWYNQESQELSVMRKSIKVWSKENHKP